MRRLLLVLGAALVICAAAGAYMAEVATRVYGALRWLPPRNVPEAVASEAKASLADVEVRAADGAVLRAWAYLPEKPNGTAVLALHGAGGHRGHMMGFAGMLARHGFTVVTPDSRGHGTSGGERFTYGVLETGDISAWTDWILQHTSARRVTGLGESMGAAILLQSLASVPAIEAAVAESPFSSFDAVARQRIEERASIFAIPVLEPGFLYFRLRYGHDLKKANPEHALAAALTRNPAPRVMLIHSAADRNIPLEHSRRLRDIAPSRIEMWEPAGVAHTQTFGTLPREFEQRVTAFLNPVR